MKLGVCTIAKNEERVAERWLETTREADCRIVLDTGSGDRTTEILRKRGVQVLSVRIDPWRFDHAREFLRQRLPSEIPVWVTLDLDEVLSPGWKEAICKSWRTGETTSLEHHYVAEWEADNITPRQIAILNRVFDPLAYCWEGAVHEYLRPISDSHFENRSFCPDLWIYQFQDRRRDRGYYFDLLNQEVSEKPDDPRSSYHLGRELFGRGRWDDAIGELNRYLALPRAIYSSERSHAMRIIAACQEFRGDPTEEVIQTLFRAAIESPYEREPWAHLAQRLAGQGNWPNCVAACINALRVTSARTSYVIEAFAWDGRIERLAKISSEAMGLPVEMFEKNFRIWVPEASPQPVLARVEELLGARSSSPIASA